VTTACLAPRVIECAPRATLIFDTLRFLFVIREQLGLRDLVQVVGRFLFLEQLSDAGAPPSFSQFSSALAVLLGRFGCFSSMIARCIEFQAVSRPISEILRDKNQLEEDVGRTDPD
jgi:hypothetical protein